MRVYLLRGYPSAEKRDLAVALTRDDSRVVLSLLPGVSLEEALSTRRQRFALLVLAEVPVIVVSDILATRAECDEFIEFATEHDYHVDSSGRTI